MDIYIDSTGSKEHPTVLSAGKGAVFHGHLTDTIEYLLVLHGLSVSTVRPVVIPAEKAMDFDIFLAEHEKMLKQRQAIELPTIPVAAQNYEPHEAPRSKYIPSEPAFKMSKHKCIRIRHTRKYKKKR